MKLASSPNSGGTTYPVEPKVQAATAASYLVTLLVAGLANIVDNADKGMLLGFLPDAIEPFVLALFPAAGAFLAGWLAKHQHRSGEAGPVA